MLNERLRVAREACQVARKLAEWGLQEAANGDREVYASGEEVLLSLWRLLFNPEVEVKELRVRAQGRNVHLKIDLEGGSPEKGSQ